MIVTSVKLANVRAVEAAEFWFRPGFNLIVGVNGVGKSSVLESLRVCISAFARKANDLRFPGRAFAVDDIRAGADALTVECYAQFDEMEFQYVIHQPREDSVPQEGKVGRPREQVHFTPMRSGFIGPAPMALPGARPGGRPLGVVFSPQRAVPLSRRPGVLRASTGVRAAVAGGLADREMRVGEAAAWMLAQEALEAERGEQIGAVGVLQEAIGRFLPGYSRLRIGGGKRPRLLIDRDGRTILVRLMSDGERGVLALVLDLTRRLVQANPEMDDPVADAEAVVLIDELELHLHPKWQRQIVQRLQTTFPRCQFIATTHSPQVVGELAHDRIQIMTESGVYSPTYSFGLDASRVLEEIMDAPPRNREVVALLAQVSGEVGRQQYGKARESLAELVDQLGENDPEVTRIGTLLEFMEAEE